MDVEIVNFIKNYCEGILNFKNKNLLETYQVNWFNLFNEVLTNPLEEEKKYRYIQCFSIPIQISNKLSVEIQFNIEALLEIIKIEDIEAIDISLKQFIENNIKNRELLEINRNLIGYALDEPFQTVSNEPIIVCIPNFQFINFVLDGNHRVDYALRHNQQKIKAYFLSSEFLISNPHLFADRLSYLLFCFFEDVGLLEVALYDKQKKGLFGILKTESSLLRHQSILRTVQEYIGGTSHQN